jgi:hypothetical protein
MRLGYVSIAGRGATDACVAGAVARLRAKGVTLSGAVQVAAPGLDQHPCEMDLAVLPDGPVYRISQDLGQAARGCRLDSDVLETAAVQAMARMAGTAALIVNKYGKLEAEGRGFIPLMLRALDQGMPVLVGVNQMNLQGFLDFAAGQATALPPDPQAIAAWVIGD